MTQNYEMIYQNFFFFWNQTTFYKMFHRHSSNAGWRSTLKNIRDKVEKLTRNYPELPKIFPEEDR